MELLIVIAILALLFTLVLSAVSQAKDKAKNLQCVNNERQITLSYKIAVDIDGEGRLGAASVADWFADHVGLPQEGWICPMAPPASITDPRTQSNGRTFGTVNSAWQFPDWETKYLLVSLQPPLREVLPRFRTGSYLFNFWLAGRDIVAGYDTYIGWWDKTNFFETDSRIAPALTPVLADGIFCWGMHQAKDSLPASLVYGRDDSTTGTMSWSCVPRHGRRPAKAPVTWQSNKPMPGAINVSFYDGHVEQVPLENLWQLLWNVNYEPPAKRPGLP